MGECSIPFYTDHFHLFLINQCTYTLTSWSMHGDKLSQLDDASTEFEMAVVDHMISSDEEESAPHTQPAPPKKRTSLRGRVVSPNAESMLMHVAIGKGVVPTSLYAEGDEDHINPTHNIIRRDILEVFVEQPGPSSNTVQYDANGSNKRATKAKHTRFSGRVGLRCRFCKHLPVGSNNASLATIYPESLEGIYRACSVRFQKRHVAICEYIPASIRTGLDNLIREKSCRGSKNYWVESALRLGFRTAENTKGIIFCPEARY